MKYSLLDECVIRDEIQRALLDLLHQWLGQNPILKGAWFQLGQLGSIMSQRQVDNHQLANFIVATMTREKNVYLFV